MTTTALTSEMLRVLRIADRDGAVVAGKGSHAGRVERVNASTVLSLIRRGLLSHIYGGEGGLGGRLTEAGRAALSQPAAGPPVHATKKPAWQLDREIAAALAEAKLRPTASTDKVDVLRAALSQALASAVQRRSGLAVFYALKKTPRGYTFESADPGAVRAFWIALSDVYYRPPEGAGGRAIGQAAGKKLLELRPIVQASWPEAMS
jgi:hypothetical protein